MKQTLKQKIGSIPLIDYIHNVFVLRRAKIQIAENPSFVSKEAVEKFYEIAMSKGATDEGGPGVRSDGNYYAYIRDFDGNKIAAKSNLK